MNAEELAWLFLDRIFRLHGTPQSIISDRGSLFVSRFWQSLTKQLGIDARTSTAYHPQTDGLTERTNQVLETYIRAYCSYNQDDWCDYLPLAEFNFNNLENSSTRSTPFFANLAYHPSFEPTLTERSSVPAAESLTQRLATIHEELRAELQHAQEQQTKYANQRRIPSPIYQPGQLVWLLRRNIRTTRPSGKLDHRKLGPYPVIQPIGPSAYHLQLPHYLSRLHPVFHVSLLEPYNDPSEFHPHSEPEPFDIVDSAFSIHSIIDCVKIGHRYEYLVHYKDLPSSEDSWVPLSDIPRPCDEMLERWHRRNPRAPRPHPTTVAAIVSPGLVHTIGPEAMTSHTDVRERRARPSSPPTYRQNLRTHYEPPAQTTTRTGRVSRPREAFEGR